MSNTLKGIGSKKLRVFGMGGHVSVEGIIRRRSGDLRGRAQWIKGVGCLNSAKVVQGEFWEGSPVKYKSITNAQVSEEEGLVLEYQDS